MLIDKEILFRWRYEILCLDIFISVHPNESNQFSANEKEGPFHNEFAGGRRC